MSEAQGIPQVTGKMFLFDNPELLTKEQHQDLTLGTPPKRYAFCAKARVVPVTLSEVPAVMKEYPLIFASQENPVLLAVTGLFDDTNLFVGEDGEWEQNRYIPGYIRRYPFGIAAETGGERMAVIVDRSAEGITMDGGAALFENGEPTRQMQLAIEFCQEYERDRLMTEQFANKMAELDLIQGHGAQYNSDTFDEPQIFAQYFSIDQAKLNELSDDKVMELHKAGVLPIAYAILMSQSNWRVMLERRARRFNTTVDELLAKQLIAN